MNECVGELGCLMGWMDGLSIAKFKMDGGHMVAVQCLVYITSTLFYFTFT